MWIFSEGEDFLDFMPNKGSASQAEIDVRQAIDAAAADLFPDKRGSKRKDYLKHQFAISQENIMQYQTQVLIFFINKSLKNFRERKKLFMSHKKDLTREKFNQQIG